jgi:oxidase EvaA
MVTRNVEDIQFDFLTSAMSQGLYCSTTDILKWTQRQQEKISSRVFRIPLQDMNGWKCGEQRISHNSGKFFSIEGIRISTNYGLISEWDQPIVNQPEVGLLGFIVKKIDGVLHFLMQAKIEPGNINIVQLSPTLQATRSNFLRVHGGKLPPYLEYFVGQKNVTIISDQLQSEQGARFYRKRNRNIIVEIDENEQIEILDNYIWVSLGQIKELLRYPNLVNMDSRSVISGIKYGGCLTSKYQSLLSPNNSLHSIEDIIHWMTSLKFKYELNVSFVGLSQMNHWVFDGDTLHHEDNRYFEIIGVRSEISNREVSSWDQPMVHSLQEGLMGFVVKKINGVYHFLVQAKLEAGNFDVIEMAPTVQCLTGDYRAGKNEYVVPYLDVVLNAPKDKIWYNSYQSEEGGRFFHDQNLNIIVEVGDDFPVEVKDNYCWMTLNQMLSFITYNNYLNSSARNLISAISLY